MTFEQMLVAYDVISEIAEGQHPMDSAWAQEWIDSLDPLLRERRETARQQATRSR